MLVVYELTLNCDMVRLPGRDGAQSHRAPRELSTAASKRLIDQLTEFPDPPMLILTGGDPLKRPDVYELVAHAVAAGLDVSITLQATPRVTREAIVRLNNVGVSRIAISIESADAETHEASRCLAGSLQRSLEILNWARDVEAQTQINTTLTPANVDQTETMATQFAELGIVLWSVFLLISAGQLPRLNAEQSEVAFERLWKQSKVQPYVIETTDAPHYRRYAIQNQIKNSKDLAELDQQSPDRPFIPAGVNDGKGLLFVSQSGVVQPSGSLPIDCGSFPKESVVDIYQNSIVFQRLRASNLLEGKCGRCDFRNVCGGSRARAYAVSGNFLAEEPDCSYQP